MISVVLLITNGSLAFLRYFELWDSGVWSAKLGQALSGPAAPPPGMEDFSL